MFLVKSSTNLVFKLDLLLHIQLNLTNTSTVFVVMGDLIALLTGCGGVYHSLTGQIQSPKFGTEAYSNNLECIWTVTLPPGYHAVLNFVDRFYLETANNCTNDYVQV